MTRTTLLGGLYDDVTAIQVNCCSCGAVGDPELRTLAHFNQRAVGQTYYRAGIFGGAHLIAGLDLLSGFKTFSGGVRDYVSLAVHRVDDHMKRIRGSKEPVIRENAEADHNCSSDGPSDNLSLGS